MTVNPKQDAAAYPLEPLLFALTAAWSAGCTSAAAAADYIRDLSPQLAAFLPGFKACRDPDPAYMLRLLKLLDCSGLPEFLAEYADCIVKGKSAEAGAAARICHFTAAFNDDACRLMLRQTLPGGKVRQRQRDLLHLCFLFELHGCVLSCPERLSSREAAEMALEMDGDYCCEVKPGGNRFAAAVAACFADEDFLMDQGAVSCEECVSTEDGMARRRISALPAQCLKKSVQGPWAEDAQSLFFEQSVLGEGPKSTALTRCFVSSLSFDDPDIAVYGRQVIRAPWDLDDEAVWLFDICYGQDMLRTRNRTYVDNASELDYLARRTQSQVQLDCGQQLTQSRLKLLLNKQADAACRALSRILLDELPVDPDFLL